MASEKSQCFHSLLNFIQKERGWFFVKTKDFLVLHVNFHYYVGTSEGLQVRY